MTWSSLATVLCVLLLASCHGSDSSGRTPVRGDAGLSTFALQAIEQQGSRGGDPTTGNTGNSEEAPLGFAIDFFGRRFDRMFVSNNGYVTFGEESPLFTPYNLQKATLPIIAPFFADADLTSGAGSVSHGPTSVDGRLAYGVTWKDVGYFRRGTDKRNTFQLLLIDRSDVSPGAFDIEFNYEQIQWETGDHSGGRKGLGSIVFSEAAGGSSAHAGYSAGTGVAGTFFEIPGSGVAGAFLDSNPTTGLEHTSLHTQVPGRYLLEIRS